MTAAPISVSSRSSFSGAWRGDPAPAYEHHIAHTAIGDQMPCNQATEHAGATSYQNAVLWPECRPGVVRRDNWRRPTIGQTRGLRMAVGSPHASRRRLRRFSTRNAHKPWDECVAHTQRELRLVQRERRTQRTPRCRRIVEIGEHEAPRMLGLGAAHQTPERRGDKIGSAIARAHRDRPACHEHKSGALKSFLGEPSLEEREHSLDARVRPDYRQSPVAAALDVIGDHRHR